MEMSQRFAFEYRLNSVWKAFNFRSIGRFKRSQKFWIFAHFVFQSCTNRFADYTINEITFDKIEEKKSIIIATAKGDEGYFTEQGYSGLFVVLEWCEWDCSQSIEVFSKEFEKRKNSKKNILLLPVESVDGYDVFKDIIKIKCPKGKLGLHIQEITVSQSYYQDNILNRYNEWK